jgi:hypothetical protein
MIQEGETPNHFNNFADNNKLTRQNTFSCFQQKKMCTECGMHQTRNSVRRGGQSMPLEETVQLSKQF